MMIKPGVEFKRLVLRTILLVVLMTIARILFWFINFNYFPHPNFSLFLHGIQFDLVVISLILAPYILVLNIPFEIEKFRIVRIITNAYYLGAMSFFMLVNCIDMIYFKFTFKRSTWDIFNYVSTGNDTISLIPQFLKDYWYMSLVFVALMFTGVFFNNKIKHAKFKQQINWKVKTFYCFILIGVFIIAGRGGFQLKPLNIMDASRYTNVQNIPLLLSTPFTLIKTIKADHLKYKTYYGSQEELNQHFNPLISLSKDTTKTFGRNVVVIIMESLSKEYMGYFNEGEGYTPFLDSLLLHSMVFTNAYANGKRSIEALPAIFSALPNLMNEAYNTSPYSGNRLTSLAFELKKYGYYSAFFHGGKNGTMGFDSFVKLSGFDDYFGKNEYPFDEDFDGNWGVYDIPYFKYFADHQSEMKEPFLSCIFSLSAHHPYKLPPDFNAKLCPKGPLKIHQVICYADHALMEYFNKVKSSAWYENTIFVITADHTAQNSNPLYDNEKGKYAIPIIIFDPLNPDNQKIDNTTQQADITPTILDYLGVESHFYGFGQSALKSGNEGFAINLISGIYQFIENDYVLYFDGNEVIAAIDLQNDPNALINVTDENERYVHARNKLRALIQSYNRRMIDNKLFLND